MKLTQERLKELMTMAERSKSHFSIDLAEAFVNSVPDLIADLEEAQRRISISEAFAKELSSELITTRKQLAEAQALVSQYRNALLDGPENTTLYVTEQLGSMCESAALDAAIAEAIADEKRNPWKQAIINELVVSYILRADHNTDPRKALAALIDYECKVTQENTNGV